MYRKKSNHSCAAILYVCSIKNGETMKQIDIARVAGISDAGLRIRIKDIVHNKNQVRVHSK